MNDKRVKRKLSAILSADVKGYSRLMGDDELATIETLKKYRELISSLTDQFRGRVVDSPGDNLLAEFGSVVDAVQCAVKIQKELKKENDEIPESRRMEFRIGVNLGDVVEDYERIYGDGVNIAARVEGLADGGGICISRTAYDQVKNKISTGYEYLGEHRVKNIKDPVGVYRLLPDAEVKGSVVYKRRRDDPRHRKRAAIIALIVLVVAVASFMVWNLYLRGPAIAPASIERMAFPLPEIPSIAVLPFTNMSGDPEQDYIGDGLSENIISALSVSSKIFVIARNSTFIYKGRPVKVQQVAEDLGVQYVLEGSIQKSGDRLRVTAQLIDALKGHHLWSEKYDREMKEFFNLQDEITIKIMTALMVTLTDGELARIQAKGTNNLEAYLLRLQGQEQTRRMNKAGNILGRQMAEKAIALDPKYAEAYYVLALTYANEVPLGLSENPMQSYIKAMEMAQKALLLDESLASAYSLMGWILTLMGQHDKGIAECDRAISLEPNSALAHFFMSLVLRYAGRQEEAITMTKEAIRLDPMPQSTYYQSLTNSYCLMGHYDEAITAGKEAIRIEPNNLTARAFLAVAYSLKGREEEARSEAREVLRINPKFSADYWAKTMPYRNEKDKELIITALRKAGLK